MATIRIRFVRFDENLRLHGLEMRNYFRAPCFDDRTGQFMMLDGVHMTLNEQTGVLRISREGSETHLMHFSRAWSLIEYRPEELKAVDEEIAKHKAARAEADEARAGASTSGKKVA